MIHANDMLQVLDLASNQLTGRIDHLLRGLPILKEFRVNNNFLTGPLPPTFASSHIEVRDSLPAGGTPAGRAECQAVACLRHKSIAAAPVAAQAAIPDEGSVPRVGVTGCSLQTLSLKFNQLTGVLPDSLGDLTTLSEFMLQNNNFRSDNAKLSPKPAFVPVSQFPLRAEQCTICSPSAKMKKKSQ